MLMGLLLVSIINYENDILSNNEIKFYEQEC